MDMNNPITIDSISFSGHPVLNAVDVDARQAHFSGSNITLRGDVWVFPFMNVYGIIGYTQGKSKANINAVHCDASQFPGLLNPNRLLCAAIDKGGESLPENTQFVLDMDGGTYGVGTTLAGGIGNWFALLDMNYTYTSISAINGNIKTFVAAPRVGYRWEYDGGRELRVFAGAMYQNVEQFLSGNLRDIGLPSELDHLLGSLAPDGEFEVSQHAEDKWNSVIGFQYAFNRDWEALFEAGFGSRETLFFSLGRRF